MSKKILIMGLESLNNFGENFVLQCDKYLVDEFGTCDVIIFDFEPAMTKIRKLVYYFVLCMSKLCLLKALRYKFVLLAVKIRCLKAYKTAIEDADMIIFGAGSFKYGTQKLWAYYSLTIDIAKKQKIPVMFNAMNIQKYNAADWRCRFLQSHLNSECVKVITSRDGAAGVERLRNDYHINNGILCAGVGDVAFWIPECYKVQRKQMNETIGINLIYGNIFKRYGSSLPEKELIKTYVDLLKKLDNENLEWELFTNGLPSDYKFGIKLLKLYGNTHKKIKVPKSDTDLVGMISGYKVILGARLHACICAYSLGVPFIGFIWDEKLYYFSKMAHLEKHFVSELELSGEVLYQKITGKDSIYTAEQIEQRKMWKEKTKEYINLFLRGNS